jgi:excisionase family DNA binding protein
VSDLHATFSPEFIEAIGRLVDERVSVALEAHANGSTSSPWLTVAEAAEYLRTSERTLQRMMNRRRIRTSAVGRRRLLHRDDLDAFMRATTGEDVAPTTSPRRREE